MIDQTDLNILTIIQNNGRMSNVELARQLHMAPSGILERVKKLEKKGIIRGYEVRLDSARLGLTITAFIHVLTSDTVGKTDVGAQLAEIPEVQEVHWIAGDFNYLVKSKLASTEGLPLLLRKFGAVEGVRDTRTTLVLQTLKETQTLATEQLEQQFHKKSSPLSG